MTREVNSPNPARGCLCPLAGRSLRPSRPPLTACPLRFAIHGCVCFHSPLEGTGSPVPTRLLQVTR